MTARALKLGIAGIVALSFLFFVWPSGGREQAPDPDVLSADVYLVVGGQKLTIPVVAIGSISSPGPRTTDPLYGFDRSKPRSRIIQDLASNSEKPFHLGSVEVQLNQYQYYAEHVVSAGICPKLSRNWARRLCVGDNPLKFSDFPASFTLLARDDAQQLKGRVLAGLEKQIGNTVQLALYPAKVSGAKPEDDFNFAVFEVLPAVLAVWMVWRSERPPESAQDMAKRQSEAIAKIVRGGLGPGELPEIYQND